MSSDLSISFSSMVKIVMIFVPSDGQVLEIGMNFLSAEDMSAVLSMQLHKSVGLGMTANMHLTSMHVEGKASSTFLRRCNLST